MTVEEEGLTYFRFGSLVPAEERDGILEAIEKIMATNWSFTRRHWSHEDSPFHQEYGIILQKVAGRCVAYSIYKRLEVEGRKIIYRAGAAVASEHHRKKMYSLMTRAILNMEYRQGAVEPVFLAWRTRNPLVWLHNSALCKAVVPSPYQTGTEMDLVELCRGLSEALYPGVSLHLPYMVMSDVYEHLIEHKRDYSRMDPIVVDWFSRNLSDPASAVLCIGEIG